MDETLKRETVAFGSYTIPNIQKYRLHDTSEIKYIIYTQPKHLNGAQIFFR